MSAATDAHRVLGELPIQESQDLPQSLPNGQILSDQDRSAGQSEGNKNKHKRSREKSSKVCRYFATKSGCRAGGACRYQHVAPQEKPRLSQLETQQDIPSISAGVDNTREQLRGAAQSQQPLHDKRQAGPRVAVAKPVPQPQQKDPREFQIGQVVRRFKPSREDVAGGVTILSFKLCPSDPDFPFELESLQCKLEVPASWPSAGTRPTLRVENSEIPRGYQINIERGFSILVAPGKTLLALLNDLDRNLEHFLSSEKAQTIKIVANRRNPEDIKPESTANPVSTPLNISAPEPVWIREQKSVAKAKRDSEVQQLEARMGRVPSFSTSADKTKFIIPLQYSKPGRLPVSLQALKTVALIVPNLYDLEPCKINLMGVSGPEAKNVEAAFVKHTTEHRAATLMAHINYLTQHLHEMAATLKPSQHVGTASELAVAEAALPTYQEELGVEADGVVDDERPHLVFLSRPPPEWSRSKDDDNNDDSSATGSFEDSEIDGSNESGADDSSVDGGQEGGASIPATAIMGSGLEKGVLFSLPHLEMTGIELLQVHSLSLSVKCDRCKSMFEFKNIKPEDPANNTTLIRTESCNKCASNLSVSYRADLLHANSTKAGFLDLQGCTVQDMLPSTFQPTCSECSTTQASPGTVAVRGDTALIVCRTCHKKLTFHIHEVKFLRVSSNNDPRLTNGILPMKQTRKKENLGITAGTELPLRGRCKHYAKSYRWFRFSCCQRVYPCDRCHDDSESHPNEHANRMICGWCSREQNYRPEDCNACQRSVIRKAAGGFWEGGKGTRDRVKMNRNDPRKYKRIGGGNATASNAVEKKKTKSKK